MNAYTIITDSGCDLSKEKLAALGVKELCLTFRFNDSDTEYKSGDMPIAAFYQQMRDGRVAKTSAVNYEEFREAFEEELKAGRDVLYIGFSSGLSSTSESAQVAAKECWFIWRRRCRLRERPLTRLRPLSASGI